jgi:hypothetical protein
VFEKQNVFYEIFVPDIARRSRLRVTFDEGSTTVVKAQYLYVRQSSSLFVLASRVSRLRGSPEPRDGERLPRHFVRHPQHERHGGARPIRGALVPVRFV